MHRDQIHVYHLVQASLWDPVAESSGTYFPPTYQADGFIHGTANPDKLLDVANHFYRDVPGEWYCLEMTVESLANTGVNTVFEETAPVGDTEAGFEGAGDELFPHLYGGIRPEAVMRVHSVVRAADGRFLKVVGVTVTGVRSGTRSRT